MELKEAIAHARDIAENCGVDGRDCAYQHDRLADWLEKLQRYEAIGLSPADVGEIVIILGRAIGRDIPRPVDWIAIKADVESALGIKRIPGLDGMCSDPRKHGKYADRKAKIPYGK